MYVDAGHTCVGGILRALTQVRASTFKTTSAGEFVRADTSPPRLYLLDTGLRKKCFAYHLLAAFALRLLDKAMR